MTSIQTMKEYIKTFNDEKLLNDDPDFENQWSNTPQDFFEWCSNYEDLKHINKEVA